MAPSHLVSKHGGLGTLDPLSDDESEVEIHVNVNYDPASGVVQQDYQEIGLQKQKDHITSPPPERLAKSMDGDGCSREDKVDTHDSGERVDGSTEGRKHVRQCHLCSSVFTHDLAS